MTYIFLLVGGLNIMYNGQIKPRHLTVIEKQGFLKINDSSLLKSVKNIHFPQLEQGLMKVIMRAQQINL